MPQIREYVSQSSVQGDLGSGRRAQAGDLGDDGSALARAGHMLQTIGAHVDEVRRKTALASATAAAGQELQEYAFTLENGSVGEDGTITPPPDPKDHVSLFQQKVKDIQGRYKQSLGDETQYTLFERDFGTVALRESFGLRKNVIAKQKDAAMGELVRYEDTTAEYLAGADELGRAAGLQLYRENLTNLERAGVLKQEDRAKREQAFLGRVDEAIARRGIRTDPEGTMNALLNGEFKHMDPKTVEVWVGHATTRVEQNLKAGIAAEERSRREAERAQTRVYEATFKDAMDLAQEGKLSVQWVRANREKIAKSDYDNLMTTAVKGGRLGGSGEGNVALYADLRVRAGRGEDVRAEAKQALVRGAIKPEQFSGITGEVESNSATVRGENWYRNGRDRINTELKPSQVNPRLDNAVLARALDDWQRYAAANPNAKGPEVERVLDGIVNSTRLIASNDILTSIPTPRFLAGQKTQPNIQKTIKDTEDALAAGRISRFEFDREMRNIRDLDRWFTQHGAAQPATDKKGRKN